MERRCRGGGGTYQWITALAWQAQRVDKAHARAQRAAGEEPDPVRTLDQCRSDVFADLGAQGLRGMLPDIRPVAPFDPDIDDAAASSDAAHTADSAERSHSAVTDDPPVVSPSWAPEARPTITPEPFSAGCPRCTEMPRWQGRRPQIQVVVALTTLLSLDDEPADLVGSGPITADTARRIAADGTWQRLLTEPFTGKLLEVSGQSHDPPQDMVDFVLARDRTCRSPGCRMPAQRCDLDHNVPWPQGATSAANLGALCLRHHRIKTLTSTDLVPDAAAGGHWWTLPSGKRYYNPAQPVLDYPQIVTGTGTEASSGERVPPASPNPPARPDPPASPDVPPY